MTDRVNSEQRSAMMAAIPSKDTGPEMIVRKLVHSLGYRYRLHSAKLPGKPDLVFPGRHKAIFVHGCFWHRHKGCPKTSIPMTRIEFWREKFQANVARDRRVKHMLEEDGWNVLVLWQCELGDVKHLKKRLKSFLG